MYCENCGAKIDDDSKFCENCGVLVDREEFPEDEMIQNGSQEGAGAPEELTDLDQLLEMNETGEKGVASEPTVVFTKADLKTEYRGLTEAGEGEKEEQRETEIKESFETSEIPEEAKEFEKEESEEAVEEPETSFGLQATSQKTKEPLELEIPDILKANGDERLLWEAKAAVRSWEAEDEWQEEDDWQEEPNRTEPAAQSEEMLAEPYEQGRELPEEFFEEPADERAGEEPLWEEREGLEELEETNSLEDRSAENTRTVENPEPEPENEESAPQSGTLFCMACGKQLPTGAAFCDVCGTPTGEVAPIRIPKKRADHKIALEILRNIFVKPSEVIKKAASEDAFYVGIGFFVIKDLILAILGAVFMGRLIISLSIGDFWLIGGGEPFGFAAKIFLCGILLDALWIGILYGGGILFKAECSIRQLTGACGTASLFPAIVLIVVAVLFAFVPVAGLCAIIAAAAVGLIGMVKAADAALDIDENKRFYLLLAVSVCYIIIVFAASQALF